MRRRVPRAPRHWAIRRCGADHLTRGGGCQGDEAATPTPLVWGRFCFRVNRESTAASRGKQKRVAAMPRRRYTTSTDDESRFGGGEGSGYA